jgi:hypothetical protein
MAKCLAIKRVIDMNARFPNEDEQNPKTKSDESKMPTEDEDSRVDCRVVICIDFGTTFTGVSWAWSNGSRHNLSDERDVHTIPSFWGQEIKTTSVTLQGRKMTLVDTPGFDDTGLLDSEVVHTVAEHLQRLWVDLYWRERRIQNANKFAFQIHNAD